MNWSRFLSALGEVGYDGPVCIEVEDPPTRRRRQPAERLRQSRGYLRQFIPGKETS